MYILGGFDGRRLNDMSGDSRVAGVARVDCLNDTRGQQPLAVPAAVGRFSSLEDHRPGSLAKHRRDPFNVLMCLGKLPTSHQSSMPRSNVSIHRSSNIACKNTDMQMYVVCAYVPMYLHTTYIHTHTCTHRN